MNYYIYLIIAVGCFAGEVFTMEFSLACLGIGLLGASLTSWLGLGIWWQVGVFAFVSGAAWIGVRPFALRHLYRNSKHVKTPAEDVIGKTAVVETAIDPVQNTGRVKVEGESWKATADKKLPAGTQCVVEKLDGVTLTVREK
ncbi:NfeD family protein [Candidatus Avelusimicrobium alvi]|uniref:NfeD family protein n=1 Tax=Candidatus Avelusimicrobium alvi TaxID=3416221 RepID=UPI003D14F29B